MGRSYHSGPDAAPADPSKKKGKHKAEDAKWYIPSFVRDAAAKIKDAERRKKKAIEKDQ